MTRSLARGALACALALPQAAGATLYSASGGYHHTAGNEAYWGDEYWVQGSLRTGEGWYPFGRLTGLHDRNYRWVAAPTLGVERGLPGVGKARAAYSYYRGETRPEGLSGSSHAAELGFFKLFTPTRTGDLAYHLINGDLFAGANRGLDGALTQRHAVIHQLKAALAEQFPVFGRSLRVEGALSGAESTDSRRFMTETLALTLPLAKGFALHADGTLAQGNDRTPRYFVSAGLIYSRAGLWREGALAKPGAQRRSSKAARP